MTPRITVTPASGAGGEPIKVSGTGFLPKSNITFYWDNIRAGGQVTSGENGSFTNDNFATPASIQGTHIVKAQDISGNSANVTFTVEPKLTITPATGAIGTTVTVTGTGFGPRTAITVDYDTTRGASLLTEMNGGFTTTMVVPESRHGPHDITVSYGDPTVKQTFTVESEAPPAPQLLLPADDARVTTETRFDWEDVTDPSGVTYALQIAADANFTDVILEESGFATSEFTLTPDDPLPTREVPYYWRVRAVDFANNESQWSSPRSLYVSAALPVWLVYVLVISGILLLAFIGFWIFRRRRQPPKTPASP